MGAQVIALGNSPDKFLEFIYGLEEGYCYIALKEIVEDKPVKDAAPVWERHFFQWPKEREAIKSFILEKTPNWEVYYSPALFLEVGSGKKSNVKGARVLWCEFDGKLPDDLQGLPEPSLRVRSSMDNHEHWYWQLEELIQPYDLEKYNRAITYALGADSSGWDANQVLRPVGTLNHKRGKKVELLKVLGSSLLHYSTDRFDSLPEPPPTVDIPLLEEIPDVTDVIWSYNFTSYVKDLFVTGKEDRSAGLMELGYWLAEMQLADEEIFAMLLNADQRWGKFAGRDDQYQRLMEIIVRARQKYPQEDVPETQKFEMLGFQTLLKTEYHLEWLIEGILQEKGYMLLTGASGVGKTQFSMDAMARLALGQDILGRTVSRPRKVGFFSLEMGLEDYKYFAEQQARAYSPEELEILEENFKTLPYGEPLYLGSENEASRIREVIEREGLEVITFDSLGSTTEEAVSEEKTAKKLMDWNDRLRKELGVATWYIHHHRKATSDNRKPNKLSDVYGSHYFTARATSVLALWDTSSANTLEVLPLKIRLAKKETTHVFRDSDLRFHVKTGVTIVEDSPPELFVDKDGDPEVPDFSGV